MSYLLNDFEHEVKKVIVTPDILRKASTFYRYQHNRLIGLTDETNFGNYAAGAVGLITLVVPHPVKVVTTFVATLIKLASSSERDKFTKYSFSAIDTLENWAAHMESKQKSGGVEKFEVTQIFRRFTLNDGNSYDVFVTLQITGYYDKYGNKFTS